jgi:hypothetical protein
VLVACAAMNLGGCTSAATEPGGAAPPASSPPASESFVRACDSSVYGDLGRRWKDDAVVVGPIAFVGVGRDGVIGAHAMDQRPGRVQAVKLLTVVLARTRVMVSVDSRTSERVAMLYDPATFNSTRVADGSRSIVFNACPGGPTRLAGMRATQFNGGIIADGHVCTRLHVSWPGGRRIVALGLGQHC